jgi:hypothetical protein
MAKKEQKVDNNISIFPGAKINIDKEIGQFLQQIENEFKMPVWVIIQCNENLPFEQLDSFSSNVFYQNRNDLKKDQKICLVIDSPGGFADDAFRIATLFNRICGGFYAIIPRYAKSAATLLALGAEKIYMGAHAEFGPLDAQFYDCEREENMSALDEVQALEGLYVFALDSIDQLTMMMRIRSGKKIKSVLPFVDEFVSRMMVPLLEQVDVTYYTKMSRILKVAKEYAVRLLNKNYTKEKIQSISNRLIEKYPTHGFIINKEEAKDMGLHICECSDDLEHTLDDFAMYLDKNTFNFFGEFRKANKEDKNE